MTPAPRTRSWFERGTSRNPGPHLDRLPIGFDLSRISLAEGVRAALASGVVLLASVWTGSYPLLLAAFAANLTCFCDTGGLLKNRVVNLLFFTLMGALLWSSFGFLRGFGWPLVVPLAGGVVFLCSMARVWGLGSQAVGNVLIVVVALSLDEPLKLGQAAVLFVSFLAGGVWAVVLTLAIWRVHPTRAATRSIGQVWDGLAVFARDLRHTLLRDPMSEEAWAAHAREHRRAVRTAIEDARQVIAGSVRARGPTSPTIRLNVMRFEAAESTFAALIALTDVLEAADGSETRAIGEHVMRLLRPVLVLLGRTDLARPERVEPVLVRIASVTAGHAELAPLVETIADSLRIAVRTSLPEALPDPEWAATGETLSRVQRYVGPLRDNLTWRSAILRHAVRATVLTVPAMTWSMIWPSPYSHWLTITVALTMQPYFAATWQRVLERIGGTVLGGLIGALVAFLPPTPLFKAILLLPLCVIGFSVRQVSYGAYIACLTPLVVVLFDVAVPGHSDTMIAGMRLLYTVVGGVLAVGACLVLWPSWEPDRLRQEMRTALLAHAEYAEAVFSLCVGGESRRKADQTRRLAGVANNNLEASLSRSLQEPRHGLNKDVAAALIVDAAVRRLAGTLVTLQHEVAAKGVPDAALWDQWRAWIAHALKALAYRQRIVDPPPLAPATSTLARLRRGIGVMDTTLNRQTYEA